jgi:hypothetical protein
MVDFWPVREESLEVVVGCHRDIGKTLSAPDFQYARVVHAAARSGEIGLYCLVRQVASSDHSLNKRDFGWGQPVRFASPGHGQPSLWRRGTYVAGQLQAQKNFCPQTAGSKSAK